MTPPPGWLCDEVLVAKVIAEHPGASPLELGRLVIETLSRNHRLLLPPPSERASHVRQDQN